MVADPNEPSGLSPPSTFWSSVTQLPVLPGRTVFGLLIVQLTAASAGAVTTSRGEGRLAERLASIRAARLDVSHDEIVPGSFAIAVPVVRRDGIAASIGLLAPSDRADPEWRRSARRLLPAAADRLGSALDVLGPAAGDPPNGPAPRGA